jgi:hypothetical protein
MICKRNYKVIIIMRFFLHQSIVPKHSWSNTILRLDIA